MSETPIVEIADGKLQGSHYKGSLRFLGIPFAAPPVGDLRWRKPQPVEPWSGVRAATKFGPAAPQERMPVMQVGRSNEDCLYLNVWTPGTEGKRPVMVWIHGGAFLVGSGSQREYSGRRLATVGDVVVVTINYRLGALGFSAFDHDDASYDLNVGIHDQVAALQWVQTNISAFGGDPGNVTIFGESAGGMSVSTLLATHAAGTLFHKAIAQSGASHHYISREDAHRVSDRLADKIGIDPSNTQKMRGIDAKQVVRGQRRTARVKVHSGPWQLPIVGMNYLPVVDDDLLPKGVHPAIASGNAKNVALMTGTTAEEWRLFATLAELAPGGALVPDKVDAADLAGQIEDKVPGHGAALLNGYTRLYPNAEPKKLEELIETDRLFVVPAHRMALAQAEYRDVYMYRFDWDSPMFGAGHATDIPFVFGGVDNAFGKTFTGGGQAAKALSDIVQQAWLSFAHDGRPYGPDLPDWQPFNGKTRPTMIFDEECRVAADPNRDHIELWDTIT